MSPLERFETFGTHALQRETRMSAFFSSKIGAVNRDELDDARLVKKLDDSGFIDKALAAP
jgi:hypothetical protein